MAYSNSPYSTAVSATTGSLVSTPLSRPTNLVATPVLTQSGDTTAKMNLFWTSNSGASENFFAIEHALNNGAGQPGAWTVAGTVGKNVTTFQDTLLALNTLYFWRVRALP